MIRLEIDEDACVGCELCCERCPTGVLAYEKAESTARVNKQEDCIQCLTCYYVCPAAAITYRGAELCPDFHRDIGAIRFIKGVL